MAEALSQIVSKQRVADHGEVYTRPEEVNAMIDLVKDQADQIETRFLEPACGTGNFLAEVLRRKIQVVNRRYPKSQRENYDLGVVIATSSVYGIELLEDNVAACKVRLFSLIEDEYCNRYPKGPDSELLEVLRFLLDRNIVHGDALTFERKDGAGGPIRFSQWSAIGRMIKRWEFAYSHMVETVPLGASIYTTQESLPGFEPQHPAALQGLLPGMEPITVQQEPEPVLVREYDAVYFRELHHVH